MSEPILRIRNHHSAHCGDPPIIEDTSDLYLGYFQNAEGDQWIFTFDRESKTGYLFGGDVNWTTRHVVVDGRVPAILLGPDEAVWLQHCWRAATRYLS